MPILPRKHFIGPIPITDPIIGASLVCTSHHTNHTLTHHTHHTSHIPHTHCTMFVCLSSLQGVVVISEPLLDCSLVGLTSDWECITLSLTPRSASCGEMTSVPLYSHRLHPLLSYPKHNFITNNPSLITPPLLPFPLHTCTHTHLQSSISTSAGEYYHSRTRPIT